MKSFQGTILAILSNLVLIFSGCNHQHIRPDEGFEGVPVAQVVALGGELAEEVRTVGR